MISVDARETTIRPCEILMYPTDVKYCDESIRLFQGCPTLAITRGGRIFLGWYSGGTREPHIDNFNLLICSDDGGKTWSRPVLVIPGSRERCVQALDIQLWTAPDGKLWVFWVQNETCRADAPGERPYSYEVDGYLFGDKIHAEWCMVCDDPDAEVLRFSEPRYLDIGFLRCKPLVLSDGTWINFNYDQTNSRYGYSISRDGGATYTRHYGAEKIETPFDETMAYERLDGSIRMLARSAVGELAESVSHDGGLTWSKAVRSGIDSPNTRFYIARTPTGRVLLVNNDHRSRRTNMTVYLSEDDGATWCRKICIDDRANLSYPDADFYDGKIYLTYDRERCGAREILFLAFTEDDILAGRLPTPAVVSKP